MILVDTNIISELWKPEVSAAVSGWFDDQEAGRLFASSITFAELSYGAYRLQTGRRRDFLFSAIGRLAQDSFANRILPFDERCA
ncbi:MAG: PIN domain-containing protein, partial [Beijerinckiaceae bacterium]